MALTMALPRQNRVSDKTYVTTVVLNNNPQLDRNMILVNVGSKGGDE